MTDDVFMTALFLLLGLLLVGVLAVRYGADSHHVEPRQRPNL
jgi:hypothetical protein